MHPRISELMAYVEAQTVGVRAAWERVPEADRAVRPSPERWSPAEIVAHLAIVERRLTNRLAELVERARSLPPEVGTAPILPTIDTDRVVNRSLRFRTSTAGEPQHADPAQAWQEYEAVRLELERVAESGSGLALGEVRAAHPVLGEFTAYEWIAFAGSHAARHAAQIREIVDASGR